jgi:hypothetical protein
LKFVDFLICLNCRWGIPYPSYVGGVICLNREDYIKVNGFSNNFWGWGGEDDDVQREYSSHHYLFFIWLFWEWYCIELFVSCSLVIEFEWLDFPLKGRSHFNLKCLQYQHHNTS